MLLPRRRLSMQGGAPVDALAPAWLADLDGAHGPGPLVGAADSIKPRQVEFYASFTSFPFLWIAFLFRSGFQLT